MNLAELAQELHSKKACFSDAAEREIQLCMDAVTEIVTLTQEALAEDDLAKARLVEPLEEVIDALTQELKTRHVQRVQSGICTLELGFVFNDCINNFERVADHCSNIAMAVLESADDSLQAHGYLRSLKQRNPEEYRNELTRCARKYYEALEM